MNVMNWQKFSWFIFVEISAACKLLWSLNIDGLTSWCSSLLLKTSTPDASHCSPSASPHHKLWFSILRLSHTGDDQTPTTILFFRTVPSNIQHGISWHITARTTEDGTYLERNQPPLSVHATMVSKMHWLCLQMEEVVEEQMCGRWDGRCGWWVMDDESVDGSRFHVVRH
jgi:hypothetical protein